MHVQLRPCLCSQLRDIACLFVLRDFCGEARFDTYTCHLRASWKWPSAGAKDMITRDQQGAQYVEAALQVSDTTQTSHRDETFVWCLEFYNELP